jgi:hypothetical protein
VEALCRQEQARESGRKSGQEVKVIEPTFHDKHGFAAVDWIDYMDGVHPADQSADIGRHLHECEECRLLSDALLEMSRALSREAVEWKVAIRLDHRNLDTARANVLRRIRAGAGDTAGTEHLLPRWALEVVARLVTPICGAHTASQLVISAAAQTVPGGNLAATWWSFIENFAAATAVLCGATPSRLIIECGRRIRVAGDA